MFFTGENDGQVSMKLYRKQMPNYILITFHSEKFFKGDYQANSAKDKFALPIAHNVKRLVITFDGKELYQNESNLNLEGADGALLRQELLKYGNYFDVAEMEYKYWDGLDKYLYPHLGLSFDSNPATHQLLVPIDDNGSSTNGKEKLLEIMAYSGTTPKLPNNARILVTTVDYGVGHFYSMKDGLMME